MEQPVTAPVATGGSAAPLAQQDYSRELAELEQLRKYRDEAESAFAQLSPHRSLVEKVIADEGYRKRAERLLDEDAARFYDESLASYEAIRARQQPQVPPELKPFEEKLNRVISFADEQERRNKQSDQQIQERATQERIKGDAAIVTELEKSYPMLRDDNYAMVQQMALDAQRRQVPFKTVADEFVNRMSRYEFTEKQRANQREERSLRSSMGAAGVPGPSETKGKSEEPFYTQALRALKANRKVS